MTGITVNLSADSIDAARKLFEQAVAHVELPTTPYDDDNGNGKLILLRENPGGAAQVYKWK